MTNFLLRKRKLGNGSCRGIKAASTTGLEVVRNDNIPETVTGYVFRWGCTSNIPHFNGVPKIVNAANSIHWCSDKRTGRLEMQRKGVSVPWTAGVDRGTDALIGAPDRVLGSESYVARPRSHAQGRNLFTGGFRDCVRQAQEWGGGYVSELINKVAEYRVFVCQNRVAWVTSKTPGNPEDVAWNVARGGRFDNVRWDSWPMAVIKEALHAARVSGTDFCGVDVMVDGEGKAYVLEVNSAPSQTSEYRQRCVAKCFDHIVTNGKQHFPDPARYRNYKDVIHPAVRGPTDG